MADVANDVPPDGLELPRAQVRPLGLPADGESLPTLATVLRQRRLDAVEVLTGDLGLDRPIRRVTLMTDDVDLDRDIVDHVVLTTSEALAHARAAGRDLVAQLADAGASGMAVQRSSAVPIPEEAVASATAHQLPLVAIDGHGSLDALVNEYISRVHGEQAQLLARADEVHRALVHVVLTGGDLADLCEQLVGLLDGAAVVTTTDGRVLASAGASEELAAATAQACFDRTGRFVIEHEPVGVRSRGGPGPQTGLDDGWFRRAMVRIVAGTADHGRLVAFSSTRTLTAADVHLLERAATVAALAVTKQQAVATVESKYRAEFIRDALAGRAGDAERTAAHAESLGWNLSRPMVVVVAEIDTDDEAAGLSRDEVRIVQDRFARAWTQAVRVRDDRAPCVGFSREVVAILPAGPDGAAASSGGSGSDGSGRRRAGKSGTGKSGSTRSGTGRSGTAASGTGRSGSAGDETTMRAVREIVRIVRGDGGGGRRSFTTGVSRPITSAADLPSAYDEALKAVSVGRQMHGEGALTHFDGLGIFRLLALVPDSADLRRFVSEALGELATDSSRENADLRQTLTVLLDTNLNVAETARILHFHYNTLRYRIAKLERMLGPFTTDPAQRLTLALALKVIQMRGL
jgi:purine catabolism regulator